MGFLLFASAARAQPQFPTTGKGLYEVGCAKCHGADGRGVPPENVGFDVPLPDFADCRFATREPDADWLAISHQGGPVRGFNETMPAFGEAFTVEQLQKILDFIRGFCADDAWPRGELNLPRPLVTEKAYPEDELVWTTGVAAEGESEVVNEIQYERRIGARHQLEVKLPFGRQGSNTGLGDLALGFKTALFHRFPAGTILSAGGEIALPTGDEEAGLGKGTTVFEPFVAFGQLLSASSFVHAQAGLEIPADREKADNEAFLRAVAGRTFTQGQWGRAWTPMIEVLGAVEFESGEAQWDLLPQLQVSLSKRQHVLANLGVRFPLTDTETRPTRVVFYVLWDWFDGGFFDGW